VRLTLDAIAVLDAIDRKGSFAAAAEALHRVPSAITYTIQKLEQDLGIKVFDRAGHRATLTEAGRELLREGRHLLRATEELECRVQRVATGWEAELRIALDDIIPVAALLPMVRDFYAERHGTRIRVASEVLAGVWDALWSGRADLAIGAPGDGPPGGGYATRRLGSLEFVFAVAREHPLAGMPEPLRAEDILAHRSVSAADSSRNLPARTTGILSGQDVLTVPDMHSKLMAQRLGLGVGYLPRKIAEDEARAGRLVIKAVEEPKPPATLHVAWRTSHEGKALKWFLERLETPDEIRSAIGLVS